jgi:predicted nucleic acid-binding Zn ribbon protein
MGAEFYQITDSDSDGEKFIDSSELGTGGDAKPCQTWLMTACIRCSKPLEGRQRRFCSRRCKNGDTNNRLQSYSAQQLRGRKRKVELVSLNGGCCSRCGYDRNYSALEFHHTAPTDKAFNLDLRSLSNRAWEVIVAESEKCELVCSNCHKEIHNPDNFVK